MANLHIENSYKIWSPHKMKRMIRDVAKRDYNTDDPERLLNRDYTSLYIEWWLHNIGYYLTKGSTNEAVKKINSRCKDVDLEELTF